MRVLPILLVLLCACRQPGPAAPKDGGPVVPVELQGLVPEACADPSPFATNDWDRTYVLPAASAFTQRLFPLLAILNGDPALVEGSQQDVKLGALSTSLRAAMTEARGCDGDAACVKAKLSALDADEVADALLQRFGAAGKLPDHLRRSGAFMRWHEENTSTLVRESWLFTWTKLLATFDEAASELTPAALDTAVKGVTISDTALWFEPLRAVTEAAMLAAGRNEAFRYEPITTGENATAMAFLKTINPDDYPFALLMLPGQGPDDPVTQISALSIRRAELAAARWKAGLVPVIVASGGHVHPDRTPYSEALEMKHYLMSTLGLPESAILLDPYARHTTTNVRNAGRLQLQLGLPPDKPILFTSDEFQAPYIGILLGPRCVEELGYQPWRNIAMYETGTDGCLTIARDVLFVDPSDPLDP